MDVHVKGQMFVSDAIHLVSLREIFSLSWNLSRRLGRQTNKLQESTLLVMGLQVYATASGFRESISGLHAHKARPLAAELFPRPLFSCYTQTCPHALSKFPALYPMGLWQVTQNSYEVMGSQCLAG